MDIQCSVPNCGSGCGLPDGDFASQKAIAETLSGYLVKAPDGPEFYCQNHRRAGMIRDRQLNPPPPPEPPKPEVTGPAAPSADAIPKLSSALPTAELIVVCQRDKVFGVFSTLDKARGIRQMLEALSPEPVYCQHWSIDTPGAQIMAEPEPSCDEVEVERGEEVQKSNGKKKRGRPKKVKCDQPQDA